MRSNFFLAGATVASHKDIADKVMVIVSGRWGCLLVEPIL